MKGDIGFAITMGLLAAFIVGALIFLGYALGASFAAAHYCDTIGQFAVDTANGGYVCVEGIPVP